MGGGGGVWVGLCVDGIFRPAGLNVGCFYAVSTLLNRMIIHHYPVSLRLVLKVLKPSGASEPPEGLFAGFLRVKR